MDYNQDKTARYLASRVVTYQQDASRGLPYELAISSMKTTKEAIDYWLNLMGWTQSKEVSL